MNYSLYTITIYNIKQNCKSILYKYRLGIMAMSEINYFLKSMMKLIVRLLFYLNKTENVCSVVITEIIQLIFQI